MGWLGKQRALGHQQPAVWAQTGLLLLKPWSGAPHKQPPPASLGHPARPPEHPQAILDFSAALHEEKYTHTPLSPPKTCPPPPASLETKNKLFPWVTDTILEVILLSRHNPVCLHTGQQLQTCLTQVPPTPRSFLPGTQGTGLRVGPACPPPSGKVWGHQSPSGAQDGPGKSWRLLPPTKPRV